MWPYRNAAAPPQPAGIEGRSGSLGFNRRTSAYVRHPSPYVDSISKSFWYFKSRSSPP